MLEKILQGTKQYLKNCSTEDKFFLGGMMCVLVITICSIVCMAFGKIKLDQYAMEIFGTTAGIVGTMFGLTAASYAFIWGDLKSDGRENRHLGRVLEIYNRKLWHSFVWALLVTVLVVFLSLGGMALIQNLTERNLYKTVWIRGEQFSKYYNHKYHLISWCVLFNLAFSAAAVGIMARMNWFVFKRNIQYAAIAEEILRSVCETYDMKLEKETKKEFVSQEATYEKIHNLEILVERILKNHESIGDAFAESQRREKLLSIVISNGLRKRYYVDEDVDDRKIHIKAKAEWGYLEEKKRESRWKQYHEKAKQEIEWLEERNYIEEKKSITENAKNQQSMRPCDSSSYNKFVSKKYCL